MQMKVAIEEYEDIVWEAYPIVDLTINSLALCAEAGEFGNKVKKDLLFRTLKDPRYVKSAPPGEMLEELGDVLWHIAQCARLLGSDLQGVINISTMKTVKRNEKYFQQGE